MHQHHEYPKYLYHKEKDPVIVKSEEEHKSMGDEWLESPAHFLVSQEVVVPEEELNKEDEVSNEETSEGLEESEPAEKEEEEVVVPEEEPSLKDKKKKFSQFKKNKGNK